MTLALRLIMCWTVGLAVASAAEVPAKDITVKDGLAYHQGALFTGVFVVTDPKGQKKQEAECRDGAVIRKIQYGRGGWKFHETWLNHKIPQKKITWSPDGTEIGTLTYKEGRPWDGIECEYNSDQRWKDHEYKGGVAMRHAYYHPNGKKAHEYLRDAKGSGGVQSYWNPEGTPTCTLTFKNEEPWEGKAQNWIEGKLISEQDYRQGKMVHRASHTGKPVPQP